MGVVKQSALLCSVCKTNQSAVVSASSPLVQPGNPSNATLDLVLQELRDGMRGINVRLEQLPTLMQEVKDVKEKFHHFEEAMLEIKKEVSDNKVKTLEMESRLTHLESRSCDEPQLQIKLTQLTADLSCKEQRDRINNIAVKEK